MHEQAIRALVTAVRLIWTKKSKLIRNVYVTPANILDFKSLAPVLLGDEKEIYAVVMHLAVKVYQRGFLTQNWE